jgi:hypothetical protein
MIRIPLNSIKDLYLYEKSSLKESTVHNADRSLIVKGV